MKITVQVKVDPRSFDFSDISHDDRMNYIQSDMAIGFSKELMKNKESLETVTFVKEGDITFEIFEMQAIVLSMSSFKKIGLFLKENTNMPPEAMMRFWKMFIEEL
jgi:hypothetical protein